MVIGIKNFITRLLLVLNYPEEIDDILRDAHNKKVKEHNLQEAKRLKLCHTHRQEANHSHYSEENCDHCKLLKELDHDGKR